MDNDTRILQEFFDLMVRRVEARDEVPEGSELALVLLGYGHDGMAVYIPNLTLNSPDVAKTAVESVIEQIAEHANAQTH